jgi:hypothetical protein
METSKKTVLAVSEFVQSDAFGPNLMGKRLLQQVRQSRGLSHAPGSLRPMKSLRPKQLRPISVSGLAIKAK